MGNLKKNERQFIPASFMSEVGRFRKEESFFDAISRKYPLYAGNLTSRFEEANGVKMDWDTINLPSLDCFVQYLEFSGLSKKSINQYGHKIMAVLNLYRGLHPEIPSESELSSVLNTQVDVSQDVVPTDEEIDVLYGYLSELLTLEHVRQKGDKCDKVQYRIEVLSHFLVACDTGARSFDEKGITWNNVTEAKDSDGNDIYVLTFVTNKKGTKAVVPISKDSRLVPLLKNIMPLTVCHRECNKWIKLICKEAGLDRIIKRHWGGRDIIEPLYNAIHFHIGRKAFCTNSLKRGTPITEVMISMGHTNTNQTFGYNCGAPVFSASSVASQSKKNKSNAVF